MNDANDQATRRFQPKADDAPFHGRARLDWSDDEGPHSVVIDRQVVLGSSPNADIVLSLPTVSRLHAEIELASDGLRIRDLQSKNGTFVQGVRIESSHLAHMARLRLASCEVVVRYLGGARDVASTSPWPTDSFGALLGGSHTMRALYRTLAKIADSDAPVLVHGETGAGKELAARAIHDASPRKNAPFMVVDCAALPETLLDAELFGHSRGAFTGATGARAGALEAARGGTVFLDEIGELPKSVQPKLLRALEAKTIRRLGENQHRPIDVRFIGATHRDLLSMVSAGEFREDLYFRLSVLMARVPPLRERIDDIEALARHFVHGTSEQLDAAVLEELRSRTWPGNVRELRNFLDRVRTFGLEQTVEMSAAEVPSAEPKELTPRGSLRLFREQWIDEGERRYLRALLERHHRNVAAAAAEAEVDRTHLYKLMRKHRIG